MNLLFWRRQTGVSPEAVKARAEADEIRDRADVVYGDREHLLRQNRFAERIRLSYEGR